MQPLYLPTLSFWENGNSWYGSQGQVRFFVQPQEGQLMAQVWPGPQSMTEEAVTDRASFPLTEQGLEELNHWLSQKKV